jgi:hypothetical protein
MPTTAAKGWLIPLITSPVQELPAPLVITLMASTLMLTTLSVGLCLRSSQPSLLPNGPHSALAN